MNNTDPDAIENAKLLIDRFGGIRPMAHKMDVPVTTVQGWKKRDVIPANRRDDVIAAARSHNVDLSGILDFDNIANENTYREESVAENDKMADLAAKETESESDELIRSLAQEIKAEHFSPKDSAASQEQNNPPLSAQAPYVSAQPQEVPFDMNEIEKKIALLEKQAVAKSTWITLFLVILTGGAIAGFFWPQFQNTSEGVSRNGQVLQTIQGEITHVKEEQKSLRDLVPKDWQAQMNSLQEKTAQAQASLGTALEAAKSLSEDFTGEGGANLHQRLARLERYVGDIAETSPGLSTLLERFSFLQGSEDGQKQIRDSVSDLAAAFSGAQDTGAETIDGILEAARNQSANLNQTLQDVPQQDLKAAALLLGLSQFRHSLNRDNQPFNDDLAVLSTLVAKDNEALQTALQNLAPHAQSGVLTPEGLSREFRTLAGEIVIASLKGEDVSLGEKAQARLNEVLQVEKDGELITGTETQATIAKSQGLLESGDLQGAISLLSDLEGPAAQVVSPWLKKAQASLLANQVITMSLGTLDMDALTQGDLSGAAALFQPPGKLIQNKETGINILDRGGVYKAPGQ